MHADKLSSTCIAGSVSANLTYYYVFMHLPACYLGYYTLPFLVHGQAKHVHACEWNPNSVEALRRNLVLNGVDPGRCTVHEGDNALSAPALYDKADRICLGLLPTSTKSWLSAVRIARPYAPVTIHVHENVADTDIEQWVSSTRLLFERMSAEEGKPRAVTVRSLEKVKTYAPHVYHIVLDLDLSSCS